MLLPQPEAKEEVAPEEFDDIEFTPLTAEDLERSFGPKNFEIEFTPHSNLYRSANEPQILFRELRALGECDIEADTSRIPPVNAMEPTGPYITWHIALTTERSIADIEEVFEFVADDCDLVIRDLSAGEAVSDAPPLADAAVTVAAPIAVAAPQAQVEAPKTEVAKKPSEGAGDGAAKKKPPPPPFASISIASIAWSIRSANW